MAKFLSAVRAGEGENGDDGDGDHDGEPPAGVLFVGNVCLDVVDELDGFPAEDSEVRVASSEPVRQACCVVC